MRLVLWDIDGTLVSTGGHGRFAFSDAFEAIFGRRADDDKVEMSGKTDHAIAREILEHEGVSDPDRHLPAMLEGLHTALAARREAIAADGSAMPGTHAAIEAIAERGDVVQSLLTGNIEPNVALKLEPFGLDRHLEADVGAYATDHPVRSELVAVARRKVAAKHGVEIAPEDTVLIGDTPRDVQAAHDNGARAVAVATGLYSMADLEEAGADAVLADLSDTDAVLRAAGLASAT